MKNPLQSYFQVGKVIPMLGKIQDVYGEQVQIGVHWIHERVVFETLMSVISFSKFQEILYSENLLLVGIAKDYILKLSNNPEMGEAQMISRFGEKNIINAKAKMSNFEWLKANFITTHAELIRQSKRG